MIREQDRPIDADPTKEYVAGGERYWGNGAQYLEEIAAGCFGEPTADEIDQMELDPQVSAGNEVLVESTLADGLTVLAGVGDKDPMFAKATEVADAWERALRRIDCRSFLTQMLASAVPNGHKVAEITWQLVEDRDDEDYGRLTLQRLAVKPRGAARFVVDKYWNLVGLYAGPGTEPNVGYRVLPPEKFAILTLQRRDEDPRGRSIDRASRTAWYLKSRIPPQHHRFLDQLILPFFLGYTAPNAEKRKEQQTQEDGTKKSVTAAEAMLASLVKLKSMFAAVFPDGAKVDVHRNESTGEAFGTAYSVLDRQIVKGILLQELATNEGQHQARAASETHMGILDYRVQALRYPICAMLDRLARLFTLYNYGARAAETIAPTHSLGDSDRRDWVEEMNAISKGWLSGWLKLASIPKLFASVRVELADDWEARRDAATAPPAAGTGALDDEKDDEKPMRGAALRPTSSAWLRRAA